MNLKYIIVIALFGVLRSANCVDSADNLPTKKPDTVSCETIKNCSECITTESCKYVSKNCTGANETEFLCVNSTETKSENCSLIVETCDAENSTAGGKNESSTALPPLTPPTSNSSTSTQKPPVPDVSSTNSTSTEASKPTDPTVTTPITTQSTITEITQSSTTSPVSNAPTSTDKSKTSNNGGFSTASFIGGIVLTLGLLAIAFVGYKFYRARTEHNYHTLHETVHM